MDGCLSVFIFRRPFAHDRPFHYDLIFRFFVSKAEGVEMKKCLWLCVVLTLSGWSFAQELSPLRVSQLKEDLALFKPEAARRAIDDFANFSA